MKAFLFDADGVVLKKQGEYFSQRFAREHGAPIEAVTQFFRNTYRECQEGKKDLKEELAPLLPTWGWAEGVDAFLEYWFSADEVDAEVMKVVTEYRGQGIICCLATDQEKNRADYIRKQLEGQFDKFYFSCELGVGKEQPEFFKKILEELNLLASEVAFRDDDEKNVEVARSLGIDARFYRDISDLTLEQKPSSPPRV